MGHRLSASNRSQTSSAPKRQRWEIIVVAAMAMSTVALHPIYYMRHHPYWGDEAWVAILARAPLRDFIRLSSSSPIGWMTLVRWAPFDLDSLRLISLCFSIATIPVAYYVARSLPWPTLTWSRVAAISAAFIALLAPIALMRSDLKQYTSDAFLTLVLFGVAARTERRRTPRSWIALVVISSIALIFSTATGFVTIAIMGSFVLNELRQGNDRRLRDPLAAAVVAGTFTVGYFLAVVIPQSNPALRGYWDYKYLKGNPWNVVSDAWGSLHQLSEELAMPALLFVLLVSCGVATLYRMGQRAMAIAIPLVWLEMFVAGIARRYPFLDQRTSHFLLVLSFQVAAVGFVGIAAWIARHHRPLSVGFLVTMTGLFALGSVPYVHNQSIPLEDVRSQIEYVARNIKPHDIVIVNYIGRYAFGIYWPNARSSFSTDHTGQNPNGFLTEVTNLRNLVYATGRRERHTTPAVRDAVALWRKGPPTATIWLIRNHVQPYEHDAWESSFRQIGVTAKLIELGNEPVAILRPIP